MMKTAVLGAGSWGTALATVLAEGGYAPLLWCRSAAVADEINEKHTTHDYLPGVELPASVRATTELADLRDCDLILVVTPSKAIAEVAARLADVGICPGTILLACTKGIERDTGRRMSEILQDIFPDNPIAVLSGPNHAEEVARKLPTATTIAAADHKVAEKIQAAFTLPWFRSYTTTDVAGVELGGAIKNVFAIAGGIVEGLGLGDNAKAALVTRGLTELTRLGVALGGDAKTFQGLSGVGDLVVTCYSELSRNHRVGRGLGEGKSLDEIKAGMGHMVAEGVPNTLSIYEAARRLEVDTPIIDQVHHVLYEGKSPAEALTDLFLREPKPEVDDRCDGATS